MSARWRVSLLACVSLLASGCGDTAGPDHEATGAPHASESFNFGEPADPADASRVIKVEALDSLTFDPATISVASGEVVTFRVTNTGKLPHDFTLGDEELQNEHDAEMAGRSPEMMMSMQDEPNAFSLPAGETKELTWKFGDVQGVLFGCHVPGHYAGGMHGDIVVG